MSETQRRSGRDGLPDANFGEKYEHHIRQMHQRLQEHQAHISRLEQIQRASEAELDSILNDLGETRQMTRAVDSEKNALQSDMLKMRRDMTSLSRTLSDLRGALASAEVAKITEISKLTEAVDSAKAQSLEDELKAKQEAITVSEQRCAELERQLADTLASCQELTSNLSHLEETRSEEVQHLKHEVADFKQNAHTMEQRREEELNDLVERLANITAMYNADLAEKEQVHEDQLEVQELLDLRADIQRRESSHAIVIEGQAKRIDYLDSEYKREQIMRKRYFNQIEDMKGKIRVYCRVRPMLPFEKSRGQDISVSVPDDMTITHQWKDEKKDREYVFDSVFTPDIRQEQVGPLSVDRSDCHRLVDCV